jgi:hypothetical protein
VFLPRATRFDFKKFVGSAYSKTTGAGGFFHLARHYRARSAAGILQRPFLFLRAHPFSPNAARSKDLIAEAGEGGVVSTIRSLAAREGRQRYKQLGAESADRSAASAMMSSVRVGYGTDLEQLLRRCKIGQRRGRPMAFIEDARAGFKMLRGFA